MEFQHQHTGRKVRVGAQRNTKGSAEATARGKLREFLGRDRPGVVVASTREWDVVNGWHGIRSVPEDEYRASREPVEVTP